MNILCCTYNWLGKDMTAGGEIYLYRLLCYLRDCGHSIKCLTRHEESYTYDGFECEYMGDMSTLWTGNNHHFEWCDIVIGQLMGDSYAHNKSGQYNKPYVFIAHNPYTSYFIRWSKRPYIIYNAENTRKETAHEYGNIPGIVLHPFVKPQPKPRGAAVTLVNCNENKGGGVLVELAKIFPHRRFIGVLGGYGEQVTADLPNITYLPNGTEMDAVWKQTGTCIVPSTIESYSQAALEAISYGIPVICSDLPGLRENLGDAGIYIKDNNVPLYVKAIEGKKPDVTGRANELYQQSIIELEQVNEWLLNIVK